MLRRRGEGERLLRRSLRQSLFEFGPSRGGRGQEPAGIGGARVAVRLEGEQIETVAGDQPKPGMAGHRYPAGEIDRVIAAELGAVNLGMGDEGGAVTLIAE